MAIEVARVDLGLVLLGAAAPHGALDARPALERLHGALDHALLGKLAHAHAGRFAGRNPERHLVLLEGDDEELERHARDLLLLDADDAADAVGGIDDPLVGLEAVALADRLLAGDGGGCGGGLLLAGGGLLPREHGLLRRGLGHGKRSGGHGLPELPGLRGRHPVVATDARRRGSGGRDRFRSDRLACRGLGRSRGLCRLGLGLGDGLGLDSGLLHRRLGDLIGLGRNRLGRRLGGHTSRLRLARRLGRGRRRAGSGGLWRRMLPRVRLFCRALVAGRFRCHVARLTLT